MTTGNPCALDFSEQTYKYTGAEYLLKQRLCLSGKMCSSHACALFLRDTRCSKFSSISFLHPTQCLPYSQSLKGRKSKQLLTHGNNKCIQQIAAHHPFSPIDMSIPWECLGKRRSLLICKPPLVSDRNVAYLLWSLYVTRNCLECRRKKNSIGYEE